ncbi:MAG: serine/threonine protein kinase [SAR202 cluster bacterium]|nr:serine/threonine protein kinase [SAR202 cluster bacterium]
MTSDDRYNLLGVTLGRYRVLETIGSGGSGRVHRARDPELGRDVAVKVLPPDRTRSPAFVERFRHEARAVARLSHPSIIKVYDYGQDSGYVFIVTELIAGGTLQAHLGRPLSVQTVMRIVAPLADALDYAHSQGVVRSDLKPSNILMDTGRAVPSSPTSASPACSMPSPMSATRRPFWARQSTSLQRSSWANQPNPAATFTPSEFSSTR